MRDLAGSKRTRSGPLDVAIVGMACRFPGANDLTAYWDNILAGRRTTSDVPKSRWNASIFCDPGSTATDRVCCRRGGYLDEPIGFEPGRYGIMPLVVDGGEPEQFLVLDTTRAALEDAGINGEIGNSARVEVVVGRGNYFNRGNLTRLQHGRIIAQTVAILKVLHPEWTEGELEAVREDLKGSLPPFEAGTIPGQVTNATAGRVANWLDFTGASYVVDAASASSLVALDLGARALAEGRADLAIVAGVYIQPDVDFPMVFDVLGALSRTGEVRPFAGSADGTLPGEGVGVVILKRLGDAERDGDRVYAVVKGVGIASDGRRTGLASPSARGHARAMRRAYRQGRIDPSTVDMIEGHGLGVPASDRAELRALRAVFPKPKRGRRALGAVSALIGHAMPAAGMAGLIKTALALHHRMIPPAANAEDPHRLIREEGSGFALNAKSRPWIHGETSHPRRAGVNAFGFAGINAHVCLEEHDESWGGDMAGCMPLWETEAILLGAADRASWASVARALLGWLETGENGSVPLKDLAFTLNTEQAGFAFRVGMVVGSTKDLCDRLREVVEKLSAGNCRSIRDARGTYFWEEPLARDGKLAFLFPGEGSQYTGMLADLCPHFPEIRGALDTSDRVAIERGHARLPSEELFGMGGEEAGIWSIGTAVNVVLTSQKALYMLLRKLEIHADGVAGHSSGEFLALAAAGVIEADRQFDDQLGELGSVFEGLEETGRVPVASLVAVASGRERVAEVCREIGVDVGIAIDNCPHQVVMIGERDRVDGVVAQLRSEGVFCEELPYHRAYHSPRFAEAQGPLKSFFEGLTMRTPRVPVYSCASADVMGEDVEEIRRLAVEQWVRPVAFRSTIETMHRDGFRVFVEVGARGNLSSFVEDTLRGKPHFAVAANMPRRAGVTQLNHLAASLYAQGVSLRPDVLYVRRRPQRIDLSVDRQPSRVERMLEVGFPEMRLSGELAKRLRLKPEEERVAAFSGSDAETAGRTSFPRNGVGSQNGEHHEVNGHHAEQKSLLENTKRMIGRDLEVGIPRFETNPGMMISYLKTMNLFLETQQEVMAAYLGETSVEDEAGIDEVSFELPVLSREGHAEEPKQAAIEVAASTNGLDVKELLLGQVSKRTGYPREMLALEFDMEGDLGIDSIKRVEILGELQALGVVPEAVDMERLSRCRTLGEVLGLLVGTAPAELARAIETPRWVGETEEWVEGREFVGVRMLLAEGDPVALHHTLGGRRISAIEPERLGLPVLPFTVMTEMLAQGAAVLMPGLKVVGFRDVQANRWIAYEEGAVALEVRALRDLSTPSEVRVTIKNRGVGRGRTGAEDSAFEGVVLFGDRRQEGERAKEFSLGQTGGCRFTAEELYQDQWLFHGPALRALSRVGACTRSGIEGTLTVLPRRELLPEGLWPELHTDPIILDAFTHLLGCWGLDKKAGEDGDLMFPLRLATLEIFGEDPREGAEVECRIRVKEVVRHRVRVDAEIVGPDGRVWVAIKDWEDWRFYWPGRYRDHFRSPERVHVGEALDLGAQSEGLAAVWLEPPGEMGRPVWRDVLERVQLGPREREALRAQGGGDGLFTRRLWGRVAAKEAVRRLWTERGGPDVYPADLSIEESGDGRFEVRALWDLELGDLPSVAIGHAEGVAVGIALMDPNARLGIAVARVGVGEESAKVEGLDRDSFDRLGIGNVDGNEWAARIRCAREALRRALGVGESDGALVVDCEDADLTSGALIVKVGGLLMGGRFRCWTAKRGEFVWGWTRMEGVEL